MEYTQTLKTSSRKKWVVALAAMALLAALAVYSDANSPPATSAATPLTKPEAAQQRTPVGSAEPASSQGSRMGNASRPVSPVSMVSRMYSASTYSALLRFARQLPPEFAFDALQLTQHAAHICSLGATGDSVGEFDSYIAQYRAMVARNIMPETDEAKASYAYLDRFKNSYCDAPTALPADSDDSSALDSPDYARLARAVRQAGETGGPNAFFTAELELVAASTASPAVFLEAVDLLAEESWLPPGYARPFGYGPQIGVLGNRLAYCQLNAAGCAAGSLLAVRHCVPMECIPGQSVPQFLARTQSPDLMRAAEAYAQALLRMRPGS